MVTVVDHLYAEQEINGSYKVQSVGGLEPAQHVVHTLSLRES